MILGGGLKLYRDQLNIRIPGTLLGLFFLGFGLFAIIESADQIDTYLADRAHMFGLTLSFAGVLAVGVSWLVRDLSNIWCVYPRTGRGKFRQVEAGRKSKNHEKR